MSQKIAFVDDEANVLEALQWVFKDEPYNTFTFQHPLDFLKKIENEEFAVVVADQLMPEIEGIEFLQLVKEKTPATVCIIMTAQPDLNIAINAMNQGNIFRFVYKPWDNMEMKTAVKNAIDLYELKSEIRRLWQITKKQNKQLLALNKNLKEKVDEQTEEIKHTEEERRELEVQLMQSQKMDALGTLAGGIAHDFNNILSGILGYTEVASLLVDKDSQQVKGVLNKVIEACERAKSLINQILSFSRQKKDGQESIQISPIIEEVIKLLRASLPSGIEILEDITGGTEYIKADPTRIHQILMNLCTNSVHAMAKKGGALKVSLAPVELDTNEAIAYHNLTPGSYLKLSVSDNGRGMDENTMKRIFDPYFTTKEKGEGTGLGLSVVHGIVKNYRGAIIVDSKPEEYTTFDVYLPCL
ncbi:ATP-binding protein [Deltaproteobacteria bacterium]|nr:ATP-binding protein [Deltaproteobacteria bacterium]